MRVRIIIAANIPEDKFDDIKKLEHHIEYSGLLENYPELENVHVDVNTDDNILLPEFLNKHINTPKIQPRRSGRYPWKNVTLWDVV